MHDIFEGMCELLHAQTYTAGGLGYVTPTASKLGSSYSGPGRSHMTSTVTSSVVLVLLSTASCWAQASEAEMRAFPMPPQNGYAARSSWNQQPYYGIPC
jgi:hypothetical protein